MPIAAPRRVGVAGLLSLLAGALVLMVAPGNPGALRLAGIGLFWWYAAVAAPLASVLLVAAVQCSVPASASRRPMALAIAGWASPMLLALVAAGAFSGEPDAPALALAALVAPLLAFVVPTGGRKARLNVVAVIAVGAAVGIVFWANLLLFADVAGLLGLLRWGSSGLAALIAFVALELARATDAARDATGRARAEGGTASRFARAALRGGGITLLYASALGFVALVALVALSLVVSPWGAWRALASRSALAFSELGPWVTEARTLTRSTAIDFTEAHRITALSPATYRVLELDRFREGQLHAGESLALRAGDRLVLDAGAHLRFEAGKRIPGSPASGVAWADPPERGGLTALGETLGAMVTLVGAALAFVGPRSALGARSVYVGSAILMALVLSSLSLGVFGAFAAPGLSIGAPAAAAVFDLPAAIAPGPRGRALGALGAVVLVVLFAATALALRDVLRRAVREPEQADAGGVKLVRPIMRLFLVAAWAASLWGVEPSRALWIGLGLAVSATFATRLADHRPGARLVGSLVGVGAFVALSILGSRLPTWAGMLGAYPVLAALPLAWGAVRAWSLAAASHR